MDAVGFSDGIQYFRLRLLPDSRVPRSAGKNSADTAPDPTATPEEEDSAQNRIVDLLEDMGTSFEPTSDGLDERVRESIRRRIIGGPDYVVLGGVAVPWASGLEKPAGGNSHAPHRLVTLEHAGRETHLLADSGRYRSENDSDISAMEVGETVDVAISVRKRVLFAGPEDLIRQGQLGFPTEPSDS